MQRGRRGFTHSECGICTQLATSLGTRYPQNPPVREVVNSQFVLQHKWVLLPWKDWRGACSVRAGAVQWGAVLKTRTKKRKEGGGRWGRGGGWTHTGSSHFGLCECLKSTTRVSTRIHRASMSSQSRPPSSSSSTSCTDITVAVCLSYPAFHSYKNYFIIIIFTLIDTILVGNIFSFSKKNLFFYLFIFKWKLNINNNNPLPPRLPPPQY